MDRVPTDVISISKTENVRQIIEVVDGICDPSKTIEDSLRLGESAINFLLGHLEQNPTSVPYVKLLARLLEKAGQLGAAIACFSRAIALAPLDTDSYERKTTLLERLLAETRGKNDENALAGIKTRPQGNPSNRESVNATTVILGAERRLGYPKSQPALPRLLEELLSQIARYRPSAIIVAVDHGEAAPLKVLCSGFDVQLVELQPRRHAARTPVWKYLASCFYWERSERTVCLSGNLRLSDAAVDRIFTYLGEDWKAFGRSRSRTGSDPTNPVCFGLAFKDSALHEKNLILLDRLYRAGICLAPDGGWALSHLMRNDDPNRTTPGYNFEEVDCPHGET